jgi:hypothetical protein
MQFREQIEQLLNCKVSGICQRDKLVTEYLSDREQAIGDLLESKVSDDNLLIKLMETLDDE